MTGIDTSNKTCRYGCGKRLQWLPNLPTKLKWVEADGTLHDYKRCAELLKEQGKELVKK